MRFSNFDEVLSRAASHPRPRRAAVAGAADPHVIEAVLDAKHRRIAEPVLVGNPGEIAALLELPLPTVLSKYRRALIKLKKHLTEEDAQ